MRLRCCSRCHTRTHTRCHCWRCVYFSEQRGTVAALLSRSPVAVPPPRPPVVSVNRGATLNGVPALEQLCWPTEGNRGWTPPLTSDVQQRTRLQLVHFTILYLHKGCVFISRFKTEPRVSVVLVEINAKCFLHTSVVVVVVVDRPFDCGRKATELGENPAHMRRTCKLHGA